MSPQRMSGPFTLPPKSGAPFVMCDQAKSGRDRESGLTRSIKALRLVRRTATGTADTPSRDWNDALPTVLASITRKLNPGRHRTCPRVVNGPAHNGYRAKKPHEPASTRHNGPATILMHTLTSRAA
jgi:hypothetical protein